MIKVDPDSSSEILRATQIVSLALDAAEFSEWRPAGRIEQRNGLLHGRIEGVFKGVLRQERGTPLRLTALQSRPAGLRTFVVPGVWSPYDLKPNASFVLFSISPSQDASESLSEPFLLCVEPADTAVPDLILAIRGSERPIADVVGLCQKEMPAWGFLFARYLDARMPEGFFERFQDFDALMRAIEDPKLSGVATRMLLSAAYSKLMLYDPAPPRFVNRLLTATQRVLQTPRGETLRAGVLETFLPNLLGITGGLTRKVPSEVLANDRLHFELFLGASNATELLAWMKS